MSKITDGFYERSPIMHPHADVMNLLAHARALEAMLRELDKKRFDRVDNCPICGDYRRHSPDCDLAKLLE